MARLINNDTDLRRFVPQQVCAVKGEQTLYDKIAHWLDTAEQWIFDTFCPEAVIDATLAANPHAPLLAALAAVAAHRALADAIPSLDLVQTANGFAVVSNQNLAPASRDRVDRLIAAHSSQCDTAINALMPMLAASPEWRDTPPCDFFRATLFLPKHIISLSPARAPHSTLWDKYLELRPKIINAEATLAARYISHELMQRLRDETLGISTLSQLSTLDWPKPSADTPPTSFATDLRAMKTSAILSSISANAPTPSPNGTAPTPPGCSRPLCSATASNLPDIGFNSAHFSDLIQNQNMTIFVSFEKHLYMKKIILLIVLAFSISFGAYAMSLREAFDALSNVPNISTKKDYNTPILGLIVNGQQAVAKNLNASQIFESGNAVYTILNQVPLSRMINGGNNNSVGAFVYSSPESKDGLYEVLIVLMSGRDGDISIIYGDIDAAAKIALQNAPLNMERSKISIHASLPNGDTYNIQVE